MSLISTNNVDQTSAKADGDVVGRDKIENHYHGAATGVVEQLISKLQSEIDSNQTAKDMIETLAYYHRRRSHDGVDGLEAKLDAAGKSHILRDAVEKKELFAKILEKWSFYATAQQILAYLLAKAEYEFNNIVHPQLSSISEVEANKLVSSHIVEPIVAECGSTIFAINHGVAMGMIYWLAEQCHVRWHK